MVVVLLRSFPSPYHSCAGCIYHHYPDFPPVRIAGEPSRQVRRQRGLALSFWYVSACHCWQSARDPGRLFGFERTADIDPCFLSGCNTLKLSSLPSATASEDISQTDEFKLQGWARHYFEIISTHFIHPLSTCCILLLACSLGKHMVRAVRGLCWGAGSTQIV